MKKISRREFFISGGRHMATAALYGSLAKMLACRSSPVPNESAQMHFRLGPNQLFQHSGSLGCVVFSTQGEVMDDDLTVPGKHDGMSCFPMGPDHLALVRNHEIEVQEGNRAFFVKQAYDPLCPGGTTTLHVSTLGSVPTLTKHYWSLTGTNRNCSGGRTPWGTWISCEEDVSVPEGTEGGDVFNPAVTKRHGYAFEVDPSWKGPKVAEPLKAMGRFRREGIAVDARGDVYQTEDTTNACFYKFKPKKPGRLAAGGELQTMVFSGWKNAETGNHGETKMKLRTPYPVGWVTLPNPDLPSDRLRIEAFDRGAAVFSRTEGVFAAPDGIYFSATSGGVAGFGQIFRYDPKNMTVELYYESPQEVDMNFPDNISISPAGMLYVCEDSDSAPNRLLRMSPRGDIEVLAVTSEGEWSGVCFSPDGKIMFANVQGSKSFTIAFTGQGRF